MPRSLAPTGGPPDAGINPTHEGPGQAHGALSPGQPQRDMEPVNGPAAPAPEGGGQAADANTAQEAARSQGDGDQGHSRRRRTLRSLRRRRNSKNF